MAVAAYCRFVLTPCRVVGAPFVVGTAYAKAASGVCLVNFPPSLSPYEKELGVRKSCPSLTAGLPVSCTFRPRWDAVIIRSGFKSETIFGFLSPDYTGKHT